MPKRHRELNLRTDVLPKFFKYRITHNGGGVSIFDWGIVGLRPFPTRIYRMDDVVGNVRGFNPVSHFVLNASLSRMLPYQDQDGYIEPLDAPLCFQLGPFDSYDAWLWHPIISSSTLSGWSIDAFNAFHDQVPTQFSLPNFVYELREMKGMIPAITKGSVSKTVSNNFLAFEFGVKPFIGDIKAILSLSEKVSKRLDYLIAQNGKKRGLSFKREVLYQEPYSFEKSTVGSPQSENGFMIQFVRQSARVTFTATGKCFQDLEDLRTQLGMMKALAAGAGFNKPARVVWNAIPYSFVVDWFFNIGKLLDSLTIQPFGGEYRITDLGYSLKADATYLVYQNYAKQFPTNRQLLGTIAYKGYERKVGLPVPALFATDLSLSPKQQALSVAMLEQRRR